MKKLLFLIAACHAFCFGEPGGLEILGLRVYAVDDEYMPPIIAMGQYITIEFDVVAVHPPDLQFIFSHATKDWIAERNAFLNEEYHTKSSRLQYSVAPNGVHHYSFHFKNDFPDGMGIVRFPYSGNYIFTLVDKESAGVVLGKGRFIVAENTVSTSMRVDNRYYTERTAPYNQMNQITVSVNVPSPEAQPSEGRIYYPNVKCIDIFQNWKLYAPFCIDVDHKNPDTFVEEANAPSKRFTVRNVPPCNEYRRLDIGSPSLYPNGEPVSLREGADLSRFQWQAAMDANGAAKLRPFAGANSDYLDVEFRLELPSPVRNDVFLVGSFNQWELRDDFKMELSAPGNTYRLHKWIRRGVYDYQYVTASVDSATGDFVDQDWLLLEGNDWRTINRYIAIVYYHDDRFGGFDRAVGSAVAKSPRGTSETKPDDRQ